MAELKVTTLVAFTISRLEAGKDGLQTKTAHYALNFHKPEESLLLEVRPDGQIVMPRTHVRREAVVIKGFLGHVKRRDQIRRYESGEKGEHEHEHEHERTKVADYATRNEGLSLEILRTPRAAMWSLEKIGTAC
jgi:hypothetical protein